MFNRKLITLSPEELIPDTRLPHEAHHEALNTTLHKLQDQRNDIALRIATLRDERDSLDTAIRAFGAAVTVLDSAGEKGVRDAEHWTTGVLRNAMETSGLPNDQRDNDEASKKGDSGEVGS